MSGEKKTKKKGTKWIVLSISVLAMILAVICWILLPQQVAMQFTFGMASGMSYSKSVVIPIALGACLLGAVLYWNDDEEIRPLVFPACGFILYMIIMILNL